LSRQPHLEIFSSKLILPGQSFDSSKLFYKKNLKQNSRTMSAAEHSSTRFCKAVLGHQASSPSHQAFSSSHQAFQPASPQKPGNKLAALLPVFFLLLQLYQGISVKGPASSTVPGRRISVQGPASSPVPVPATGSQTGILTLTPQPVVASTVKRAYYWDSPFLSKTSPFLREFFLRMTAIKNCFFLFSWSFVIPAF
jgi:hypothetical protein